MVCNIQWWNDRRGGRGRGRGRNHHYSSDSRIIHFQLVCQYLHTYIDNTDRQLHSPPHSMHWICDVCSMNMWEYGSVGIQSNGYTMYT